FVILLTAATIIMGISTVSILIPQAAYASTDGADRSSSSNDDDEEEDCGSDELPASIDGTINVWAQENVILLSLSLTERESNIATL
ncbi:MAG: hypothetical protein M3M84_03545, partial [Thermoproteota archaeon]|nr:hypothetical protein [Thermoproteota archaeon]